MSDHERKLTDRELGEVESTRARIEQAEETLKKAQDELQKAIGAHEHVLQRLRKKYSIKNTEKIARNGQVVPINKDNPRY